MLAVLMYMNVMSIPAFTQPPADYWTLLSEIELTAMQQAYLDRMAAPRNPHPTTLQEWEAREEIVRQHVREALALAPEPERLPLNIHVSDQLDRDDYVVKRIYWQTWPSYYASGYLYMPKGVHSRVPAILNPHGHWENGARHPIVQSRLIALAKKGYVCLAVDSVHAYDYYSGVTPMTIMTWNNMRGIDLLCSLPEVDPSRIGCTGCSGGGQQTFYLMCLDDRLKAAVPVNMVSEARRILSVEMHHCPCNHVPGFLAETDQTETSAVFAPAPALYICVTQDWTKWFPQEGYPEIRSVYRLYGAEDRVKCIQYDWSHDYSQPMREAAYAWFNRWLRGLDDPEQAKEGNVRPEPVDTLAALDGPPPGARGPEAIFEERRHSRAGKVSKGEIGAQLRRLFRQPVDFVEPQPQVLSRESLNGLIGVRTVIYTEAEIRVPVVLLLPETRRGRLPALVVASDRGKADLISRYWDNLKALVEAGTCVALADVRFYGEWSYRADIQGLNGIFFGRSPAAVGAHDLLAVAAWLESRPEITGMPGLAGIGNSGPLALMAAAMEPRVPFVAACGADLSYARGRTEPTAPHLVTVGDLPDVAKACAPRPVWLGPAEPTEESLWRWLAKVTAGV